MKVLHWDFKEQVPFDKLDDVLSLFGASAKFVEDGGDEVVLVIGPDCMSQVDANGAWKKYKKEELS